ncbi:MAG: HD domain-containing protein [Chloroflexota bacterium]
MGNSPSRGSLLPLAKAFAERGRLLYVVGGSVRDDLLGRPTHDVDLTTDAHPPEIKQLLISCGAHSIFEIGAKFGTIGGTYRDLLVEITTFRGEQYEPGSRKPAVTFGASLEDDLSRRDFTINAIAQDVISGELFDPFSGRDDLERQTIRAVGEPGDRFSEDPLRLLRAVRFACELGFGIDPDTRRGIAEQADALAQISRERIAQEMARLLTSSRPGTGIRWLCDLGLMRHVVPEVLAMRGMTQDRYHHKDVFEHTLQVVDQTSDSLSLRWAALLHDIAKPKTRTVEHGEVHFFGHEWVGEQMAEQILSRLNLDRPTITRVALLVGMHQRANSYDADWTDGAVRRFMREAGDGLDELLSLSRADVTSRRPERVRAAARRVDDLESRIADIRAREDVERLASPLDGNALMQMFGRGPGPWIKGLKDHLLAAVLDGTLAPDDAGLAEELARAYMADQHPV